MSQPVLFLLGILAFFALLSVFVVLAGLLAEEIDGGPNGFEADPDHNV